MSGAFRAGDVQGFNQALAAYHTTLAASFPDDLQKMRHEVWFNQMQPFYHAMVIYVFAGLLAGLFWFNLSEPLRRSAVWLIWLRW